MADHTVNAPIEKGSANLVHLSGRLEELPKLLQLFLFKIKQGTWRRQQGKVHDKHSFGRQTIKAQQSGTLNERMTLTVSNDTIFVT